MTVAILLSSGDNKYKWNFEFQGTGTIKMDGNKYRSMITSRLKSLPMAKKSYPVLFCPKSENTQDDVVV
jgi:hypothetical protein